MSDSILYVGTEISNAKKSALGVIVDAELFKSFSDITLTSSELISQLYEAFLGTTSPPPTKNVLATKLHELLLKLVQVVQVLVTGLMKVEDFVPGLIIKKKNFISVHFKSF